LQWQHDAAEPQVAEPHTLPGSSWQVPLTTHVYVGGQVPHDPPQPSSPHTIEPQKGVQVPHCPWESQGRPPGQVPQDPPHPSSPQTRPVHEGTHDDPSSGAGESWPAAS
jgi:hypothetical protein